MKSLLLRRWRNFRAAVLMIYGAPGRRDIARGCREPPGETAGKTAAQGCQGEMVKYQNYEFTTLKCQLFYRIAQENLNDTYQYPGNLSSDCDTVDSTGAYTYAISAEHT